MGPVPPARRTSFSCPGPKPRFRHVPLVVREDARYSESSRGCRLRFLRLALPLVAMWIGCGAVAPDSELAELTTDEAVGASGLVWLVDPEGRHQTLWVSIADGRPLASQPIEGPVWTEGSALWQWVEEPVEVAASHCVSAAQATETPEGERTVMVRRGVLRELTESTTLEVCAPPSAEDANHLENTIAPFASVGPYLFLVQELYIGSCSARASWSTQTLVWDLAAAHRAEVLTDREERSLARSETETAVRRLREESSPELEREGVELVALWPRWDLRRGLGLSYVFAAEACPSCSDGEWSSHTIATRVPASRMPERLAEHADLPRWVRRAAARAPDATVAGFTRVTHRSPAMVLDALRR